MPPTIIRSVYSPGLLHMSNPTSFTVLARGEQSTDKYRYTPDELYELGKLHPQAGHPDDAPPHLTNPFVT